MDANTHFQASVGRETHGGLLEARNEGVASRGEQLGAVGSHFDVVGEANADQAVGVLRFLLLRPNGSDIDVADELSLGSFDSRRCHKHSRRLT